MIFQYFRINLVQDAFSQLKKYYCSFINRNFQIIYLSIIYLIQNKVSMSDQENNNAAIQEPIEEKQIQKKVPKSHLQLEADFRRRQQEYYELKKARKQQIQRLKKQEFGESSSDDDTLPIQQATKVQEIEKQIENIQEYEINSLLLNEQQKENIKIEKNKVIFNKGEYDIKSLMSLKVFVTTVLEKGQLQMHLTFKTNLVTQLKLGIPNQLTKDNIIAHYRILAKLIQSKTNSMQVKIIQNDNQLKDVPELIIMNSDIYGFLFKKSQYIGRWDKRFIVINKQGLFSYKKLNEKASMIIYWKEMNSITTQFQFYEQFLIVNLVYGKTQTAFGLPIDNFLSKNNWLYHIYSRSLKHE